jgi:uncharacterized protein
MASERILSNDALREILTNARVIAVLGMSDDPYRPSYQIGKYLKRAGYTVYPVNPTLEQIDGDIVYPSLKAVPETIDIVNIFRRPEFLPRIVDDVIAAGGKFIWAQLGIANEEAARKAAAAGIPMVMNNCIKVTHAYLMR